MDDLTAQLLKPRVPLPEKPRNFQSLEGYSNIKRFWDWLEAFHNQGLNVVVPKKIPIEHCRRAVVGIERLNAGGLVDENQILKAITDDEEDISLEIFNLSLEARDAMQALLEGDKQPLSSIISSAYKLEFEVQIAFSARRELLIKADTRYVALEEDIFPLSWDLKAVRLRRDDWRMLLDRAAMGFK
jgi:hypothetical protein